MALLGMLAAGAARGAGDASQRMFDQEQAMKFEMGREELRMKYLDREMSARGAAMAQREQIKSDAAMERDELKTARDQERYERERKDKLSDADIAHKRSLEKSGFIQNRMDARANKKALLGGEKQEKGITLSDGTYYVPLSPEGKKAVDLINAKKDTRFADALYEAEARGLVGQAASSIEGLTEGAVPTAKSMVRNLYNQQGTAQQQPSIKTYNPKTGSFN